MGYTTDFYGSIEIQPPLNSSEIEYLRKFSDTRRMDRERGGYFVDGGGMCGQDREFDILEYNSPPPGQPGLWCKWVPNDNGTHIEWSGAEKFYDSAEWMEYLIEHFLKPDGIAARSGESVFDRFTFDHILNGEIDAQGENPEDRWKLKVEDNKVSTIHGRWSWDEE